MNRIEKLITFCGKRVRVACDGNCKKAWGSNRRPRVQITDHPDDFAWLADDELEDAPADPGTYEGSDGKPENASGPDDINRWCVRECERMEMSNPDRLLVLRKFGERMYNMTLRPLEESGCKTI